jgi:hypothetical protein
MIQRFTGQTRALSFYLKYLVVLLLLFAINVSPSKAQGESFWSEQQRIPEYVDDTEEPPFLIADSNHTVHAFNSQPLNLDDPGSPGAVFYREWTLENGWTYPNDILLDPDGGSLILVGITNDQSGRVHLITQKDGDIYYAQNYLVDADLSTSWPTPVFVAGSTERSRPGVANVAAIATSKDGSEVVVIYGGSQFGNGLYFTSSSDSGSSWTEPYPVYLTGDETIIVTDPDLYAGDSGMFHAVWSTFLNDGSAGPGFYANYDPQTKTWSEPVELDTPGIRTPSVIEKDGELFVGYYHANGNHDWWRRSSDKGKTWSLPKQISQSHKGTNGNISFAVDGANILHAFWGQRIDDNNHGMWHEVFNGGTFANIEAVVRGPQIRDKLGGKGFDPRSARAVIVNGNTALVTWGTDGAGGMNGAWFSYKRLDAPELSSIVLESPTLTVDETSVPALPTPTDMSTGQAAPPDTNSNIFQKSPGLGESPQTSIYIGVIPVILLLAGIVVLYYIFQDKK